jgi:urea carboxylase/allophanate hydrolase
MPIPLYGRLDGLLYDLKVKVGDSVKVTDLLYVVEAAKSQLLVNAPYDGKVVRVLKVPGDRIGAGELILELEIATSAKEP